MGRDFVGTEPSALVLGDNIFYGSDLQERLTATARRREGATVFAYHVQDPERYGVVSFDASGRATSIDEKPTAPRSSYGVTGLYFYDGRATTFVEGLVPSASGELEITDLNRCYLDANELSVEIFGRGYAWLDTGTHASMLEASQFIETIERRQGLKISCPEEIAFRQGFIDEAQLEGLASGLAKERLWQVSDAAATRKHPLTRPSGRETGDSLQPSRKITEMIRFVRSIARLFRMLLIATGIATVIAVVWLVGGYPLYIDRLVIENSPPAHAAAIVCISGGLDSHHLPLEAGWNRVYTAVQLHADGYAPQIIFSGGGTESVSEAEVYAEAAQWLGSPAEAIALDPWPGSTADHPGNLLKLAEPRIQTDTPLLIVTSASHSKRTALCFRKAGFTSFRIVTSYEAEAAGASVNRSLQRSTFESFRPSGKRYDDPFNRLKWGLDHLLTTLRELAAIAVYRYNGQV